MDMSSMIELINLTKRNRVIYFIGAGDSASTIKKKALMPTTGEICQRTGRYRASGCGHVHHFDRGDTFTPCNQGNCYGKSVTWTWIGY